MIFPGAESAKLDASRAWFFARNDRTPRARSGSNHNVCNDVTIASRPNGVENHGIPAKG